MKTTLLILATSLLVASGLSAQSDPTYIPFGGTTKGALYEPDDGPSPSVGILVMHRTGNFLSHIATRELSRRGYLVLGRGSST